MKLRKRNGGKEIINEMGMAVVGIAVIIVFRGLLSTLVTTLMTSATTQIGNLFTL